MTSAQLEHLTRPAERHRRMRGQRSASPATRPQRFGLASEAIVAGYIRDLAAGAAAGSVGRSKDCGEQKVNGPFGPLRSNAKWQT